jgi:predicted RNA-binding Zn ribbon-like protein
MTGPVASPALWGAEPRMAIQRDFGFIGRLCLDFAQTGDMGWGRRYERLTSASELARWLTVCSLELDPMRVTTADLARGIRLRRAVWRIAQALLDDQEPRRADVRQLNGAARRSALVRALTSTGQSLHWHRPTATAALSAIAQDAVVLFGDPQQRARLRRCENSACRVIFYDDSRPGTRRWCASNRCGDRIRARAYRRRHA